MKANIVVTMPDAIAETISECLSQKEEPKRSFTHEEKIKLKAFRRIIDATDFITPEYLKLEKELREEFGPDYFDYCLEV